MLRNHLFAIQAVARVLGQGPAGVTATGKALGAMAPVESAGFPPAWSSDGRLPNQLLLQGNTTPSMIISSHAMIMDVTSVHRDHLGF
ncbi:hypothetical protein HPB50_028135 [Hyalomma asiaticum]|nr:hypothetical protein HPB50_028135 [Hyalomma asiaticum]